MKKVLMCIILLSVMLVGCGKKEEEEVVVPVDPDAPIENIVIDNTETKQGDLTFKDLKIEARGATNYVSGKVTNTGTNTESFTLELKLRETKDGLMLGKVSTEIEKLEPNETREFEISLMGDFLTVTSFEVNVIK